MNVCNMPNGGIIEFTKRLLNSGGISVKGIFLLPVYYVQLIVALPLGLLQYIIFGNRIRKTTISQDPVFILGHYRCGTTYLQKLMVSNSGFGCLTNYDSLFANSNLLFGRKTRKVLQQMVTILRIKNPFFNTSAADLSDPCEEDDYLMNKASAYTAYWGFVFPKRWKEWLNGSFHFGNEAYREGWKREYMQTIKYGTFRNNGRQLILKNPPNTERISLLLELFPNAKFIYIYRNPYNLYSSTRNMWKKAILSYYSVQNISESELDDIVFNHFIYLTGQYEKQKMQIPEGHLIEISYEELKSDPYNLMQKIYSGLNLRDFGRIADNLKSEIEKEKNYTTFSYELSDAAFRKIEEHWSRYIRQWGYTVPHTSGLRLE